MQNNKAKLKIVIGCLFILIGLLCFTKISLAASTTHYITPAGAGSKNGADWSNACQGFTGSCAPSSMVRGDTYVVAGGNYTSAVTFSTAASGSTYIYIRKAQLGTYNGIAYNDDLIAGWNSSYETTQAVWSSTSSTQWTFTTGYWDVDGVTPSTKWATTGYGIKVTPGANNQDNTLISVTADYVKVKHLEIANSGSFYNTEQFNFSIWGGNYGTISSSYLYAGGNLYRAGGTTGWVAEYNRFGSTWYSSSHHSEAFAFAYASNNSNTTIRYNFFDTDDGGNTTGTIIDLGNPGNTNDGVYIYGNIFLNLSGHNGIGTGNSGGPGTLSNWKLYNNTFINSIVAFACLGTGVELRNSLFYGSSAGIFGGGSCGSYSITTRSNNYWNASTNDIGSGTNDVTSAESTSVLFANYAGANYHLGASSQARNAGANLGSPYNTDPDGVTRGLDGTWDIGAYEYVGGVLDTTPPAAPTGVTVI